MVAPAAAKPPLGTEAWDKLVPDLAGLAGKPQEHTRQRLALQLSTLLCSAACLHPAVIERLRPFQRALMARIQRTGLADLAPGQQPARFLDYCYQQACYYYPETGRAGQVYAERLGELFDIAADALLSGEMAELDAALVEQAGFDAQQMRRAALTERRLAEAADAEFRTLATQQTALSVINKPLAGAQLPEALPALIRAGLVGEFQYLLINKGPEAARADGFWRLWEQLLSRLAVVFDPDLEDQQLYALVPNMLEQIELSQSLLPDPTTGYRHFTDTLADALATVIQKQPQALVTFTPMQVDQQVPDLVRLAPGVARELAALEPGGWYKVTDEQGSGMRCRLAFKNPKTGSLIFSDFSGRKVLHKSFEAFGLALSAGVIEPLLPDNVQTLVADWLTPLLTKVARARARKADEDSRAGQEETEESAPAAGAVAQLRAAAKARAEAAALAQQQLQPELEATPERLQAAAEQLDRAHVGAQFSITDERGETHKVKLSVIIKSTGKYIFADQLAQKWGEFSRAQLLEKLAAGRAVILTQGNLFEDQLAKVITGIRRDFS